MYASATVRTPFDPETHTNAPDTVTLEGMIRTLNQEPDATFLSAMAPYLDLHLFLTHVAVETYVADYDCILATYTDEQLSLLRFVNKQLSQFIPWDKDNAFAWTSRAVLRNADQNVLMRRLMAIPNTKSTTSKRSPRPPCWPGARRLVATGSHARVNQIQQAAYADPNKLYGYLASFIAATTLVSTPRPRWWCRLPGSDAVRSRDIAADAINCLQLSETGRRRRSQCSRVEAPPRRTGEHLRSNMEAATTHGLH